MYYVFKSPLKWLDATKTRTYIDNILYLQKCKTPNIYQKYDVLYLGNILKKHSLNYFLDKKKNVEG